MVTPQRFTDAVVENRRVRLRRWINEHCGGSQVQFIATTADGEKQLNQGELSGLLKSKSFGEKKARSLEVQAGMPLGYLDESDTVRMTYGLGSQTVAEATGTNVVPAKAMRWPFLSVSYSRLMSLKNALGPRASAEALRDIDEHLDILVTKWERSAARKKNSS